MKLRWYERILMALGGLLIAGIGAGIILSAAGVIKLPEAIAFSSWLGSEWYWIALVYVVGAIVLIWGLWMFVRALTHGNEPAGRYYTLQSEQDGKVRISVQAIDHLVHRCLDKYRQIVSAKVRIGGREDAMEITMHMTLHSQVRIPELLTEVREDIKRSLLQSAGVTVQSVQIYVDATKNDKHEDDIKYIESHESPAPEAPVEDYINTTSFYTTPVVVTGDSRPEPSPVVNEPTIQTLKEEVDLGPNEPLPVDLSAQAFPFPEKEAGVPLEIFTRDIPIPQSSGDGTRATDEKEDFPNV